MDGTVTTLFPRDGTAIDALTDVLASSDCGDVEAGAGFLRWNGVALITLANPQRLNALNLDAWRRLARLMQSPEVVGADVVVVRGSGERAFGAGADISEFPETRMSPDSAAEYNEAIASCLRGIQSAAAPVFAMVHGLAVGGGCELAAACDVRICADDARLGIPIGHLGVTLGYTETAVLVRLIGPSRLKRLLFTGELVDAQTSLSIGLVDEVVPRDRLASTTARWVTSVLQSSRLTMRAAKAVTDMATRDLRPEDTDALTRFAIEVYGGPALAEGVDAFLSSRKPNF